MAAVLAPVKPQEAEAPTTSVGPRLSRVLTAESGPFHLDPQKRETVCLLADVAGTRAELVISGAHRTDPVAMQLLNLLKMHPQISFSTRYAPVSEIGQLYKRLSVSASTSRDDDSDVQERVKTYIREATAMGASDLKIIIVGLYCRIRYTIHGRTRTQHELPAAEGLQLCRTLYNTMCIEIDGSGLDINAMQEAQLKADVAAQCGLVGSRISTRPANGKGVRIVMRLLPPNHSEVQEFSELGYHPELQIPMLRDFIEVPFGIVLISGVTGSGKSTTVKAMIENISRDSDQEVDILTIEDPVEYDISAEGCTQTPLVYDEEKPDERRHAWANALRNAMRQAPKFIVPGEIRDAESAVICWEAGVTGHNILSTVHTFDAPSIIDRIRALGVTQDRLFNPALTVGLINQSLVRKLCRNCSIPYSVGAEAVSADVRARIEEFCEPARVRLVGPGCDQCKGATPGLGGRLAAAELIRTTAEFMRIFLEEGMLAARIYWVKHMGGMTKLAHARWHIHNGDADPRHVEKDVLPLNTDRIHLGV